MSPAAAAPNQPTEVGIDEVARFWDERPCNVRHSPLPVGTREYSDEVEARKYLVEPHIPGFAQFDLWSGKRVLEIGCGIGTDTLNFARAGATVTAIDLSANSLEIARQRADVCGLADRIHFYAADGENLSAVIPAEPYDLVYSFGVIHHTPHPREVVEQIKRSYVRSGTILKIMVYHRYSWKGLVTLLGYGHGAFWNFDRIMAEHSEAQTGCPVTFTYARRQVESLLGAGVQLKDVSVEHIFPYRIKDYVRYRYVKNWWFRIMPASLFQRMERRLGWHLCITAEVE